MYSVKRIEKNETIWMTGNLGFKAPSTVFAVVTQFGDIMMGTDMLGRKVFETYNLKSAAQKQANFYNAEYAKSLA